MKQHQSVWLPDHEQHLLGWMTKSGELVEGRGTYQIKKLRLAMKYTKGFRNAVDIGSHVGLWAMQLAPRFHTVHCFEPLEEHRDCFMRNAADFERTNVIVYPYALGAQHGSVSLRVEAGSSGNTFVGTVGNDNEFDIEMRTLDQFELDNVDFMKIDCEGFEADVVRGAEQTIRTCKPCMIVEQKPHVLQRNYKATGTPAVDLLVSWGATIHAVASGDYVLAWAK